MASETNSVRNGVDVHQLSAAVEAVKQDSAKGKLTFVVNSEWMGGFKARHVPGSYVVGNDRARHQKDHALDTDEPREILGADSGISPAETIMSALAACLSVGYAANAAAMGIEIEELRFEITGNGSLEGFMNLGNSRPGLGNVSVRAFIKSDAPRQKLQELHDYVNAHSPIWDTISNPVTVTSELASTDSGETRPGRSETAAPARPR